MLLRPCFKFLWALFGTLLVVGWSANHVALGQGQALPAVGIEVGEEGYKFSFVHVTDGHLGSPQGNTFTPQVLSEIKTIVPRPAFIVNSGDITETGSAAEYEKYVQMLTELDIPAYHTAGNHESRWLDAGKAKFNEKFGPASASFEFQGIYFITLDTSINSETYGHLENSTLDWLKNQLRSIGNRKPVIIFTHHPLGYDPSRFVDNDEEFFETVRPYNVIAVFTGHGHTNVSWTREGIPFFMTDAVMEGGYRLIVVTQEDLKIYTKVVGQPIRYETSVPLKRAAFGPKLSVISPASGQTLDLNREELQVKVKPHETAQFREIKYRVDLGSWKQLVPDNEGNLVGSLSKESLGPGKHVITVRGLDEKGNIWGRSSQFWISGSELKLRWSFKTLGGIQGAVAASDGLVVFGSNDGKVYALDASSGQKRWEAQTGGPVLSTPMISGNLIYVGSVDGKVYALDKRNGSKVWEFATKGPVLASPTAARGKVFVGSYDGTMYALDSVSGAEMWTFRASGPIRSGTTYAHGHLFFGSWDRNVYALDADSGQELWRYQLGRQVYYAPASAPFLYYLGRLFVTAPGDARAGNVTLTSFSPWNGSIFWQSVGASGYAVPAAFSGLVAVNSSSGTVSVFHPWNGSKLWTFDGQLTVYGGSVAVSSDYMVQAGVNGELQFVWPGSGVSKRFSLGTGFIFSRPVIASLGVTGAVGGVAAGSSNGGADLGVAGGDAGKTARGYPRNVEVVIIGSMDGALYAVEVNQALGAEAKTSASDRLLSDVVENRDLVSDAKGERVHAGPKLELPRVAFKDLESHWARTAVEKLGALGLVSGYPDGTFRPQAPLTRAELAAILSRYLGLKSADSGESSFSDLAGHWALADVAALEKAGLVYGYTLPSGQRAFKPNQIVSRAEAAVLIWRMLRLGDRPVRATRFADVSANHWARQPIESLADLGLVSGYQEKGRVQFKPDKPISRAEAVSLLYALG